MKRRSLILSILLLLISASLLKAQELVPNHSVTGVCYAGTKINRIYIPPPKGFLSKAGAKGGASITVIYSGFSAEAKSAVDYAVQIIESMLPPDTKLTIRASWTLISNEDVLGNSSITGFAPGLAINAFDPMAVYPISVAEKIAGKDLNQPNEADLELVINSRARWYLGTDGKTPVTKHDLVTVVIHELCHGLGFFDSFSTDNGRGVYIPIIYDKFIENLSGKRLTDTIQFPQNSDEIYSELVGGQLYFGGPLTKNYLAGSRARLFSPATWDPGSSVSHLDELRTLKADALMTPYIDFGEAIHDPGNLTFSILGDLGWINTRIVPGELKDNEAHLSTLEIRATIVSDTLYNKDRVGLVYSFNGFSTSDTLIMSLLSGDSYSGLINIPSYNTRIDYYFFAIDKFSRIFNSPSLAGKRPYSVFIGTDTVKPVIAHVPVKYYFESVDTLIFDATVNDNLGIDTVYIEYNVNNRPTKYSGFSAGKDNLYTLRLNIRPEQLDGGDILNYRIVAVDKATGRNSRVSPASGYYNITIEALMPAVTSYSTDFSNASSEFFNSGFEIIQPANFSSMGLHSEHPYKSPEDNDKTLEFSSVLRYPVIFDQSGIIISFREVVLVEPGAEGSVFGFSDFYDYVIIEGSKDYGKSWFRLADGYDSRLIPSWESAYNSSIDGMNSTYTGSESMMLEHSFFPRIPDKISSGDSLLIRFRLFSDPYANGWGWAIDDLKIAPIADQVEENSISEIKIYPNPGNGRITMALGDDYTSVPAEISAFDFTGKRILQNKFYGEKTFTIDISGNPAGLYLIVIRYDQVKKTIIYSLIK